MEGTPSDDELRRRLDALNASRADQGLKPRSFKEYKKSFFRAGRRTRNGLVLEDYPQAEASSATVEREAVQVTDTPRPPAPKRAKVEGPEGVSLRSASAVRRQQETDENRGEVSSTESVGSQQEQEIILRSVSELRETANQPRSSGHAREEASSSRELGSVGSQQQQEIILRSVSELRETADQPRSSGHAREEASSSRELGGPEPNYHVQVEVQANRNRPKLVHHWFGERITVVKDLVRGKPLQQAVTLRRLGKGNSRVVYEWGSFVVKFTTVAFDHGDEEQLTELLPEVTALVIHVVPVVARMGPLEGAARHVVFALVQQKVIMAQSWLDRLDAETHRQWHYYLACVVAWLSSKGLSLADVTVSNLGLETLEGHIQLFDLATWKATGVAKWSSGSGFERYLRGRCPEVLDVIQSHKDRTPERMFEAFLQGAGPFVSHLVHKRIAGKQNGRVVMCNSGIIQLEAEGVLP